MSVLDDVKRIKERAQADATVEAAALDVAVALLAREAEIKAHAGELTQAQTLIDAAGILHERWERNRPLMVRAR